MRVYVTSAAIARQFPADDIGIILCEHIRHATEWDFILDNGAYVAWKNNTEWDEKSWLRLAQKVSEKDRVQWAVVPDVVTDREATLRSYQRWAGFMKYQLGFRLAMAVQDGMTPTDIPTDDGDSIGPDIIFVGGSTEWKWKSLRTWTAAFDRVHVGKANTLRQLTAAYDAGADSVDGSGFSFAPQRKALRQFHNRIKMPRML
tara:strand:- start:62 stop:667 length:606 start_codon:yes stop_codon:yes gene_type:complete